MLPRGYLIGIIATDISKHTSNITSLSFCKFRIACSEKRSQGERKTHYFSCIAWEQQARFISTYLKKGDRVFLEFTTSTNVFTDETGRNVKTINFTIQRVEIISKKENNISNSISTELTPSISEGIEEDLNETQKITDYISEDAKELFVFNDPSKQEIETQTKQINNLSQEEKEKIGLKSSPLPAPEKLTETNKVKGKNWKQVIEEMGQVKQKEQTNKPSECNFCGNLIENAEECDCPDALKLKEPCSFCKEEIKKCNCPKGKEICPFCENQNKLCSCPKGICLGCKEIFQNCNCAQNADEVFASIKN